MYIIYPNYYLTYILFFDLYIINNLKFKGIYVDNLGIDQSLNVIY